MKKPGIYENNWIDRKTAEQENCEHKMYRKICSCCGKTLSSEKLDEENVEIVEVLINTD